MPENFTEITFFLNHKRMFKQDLYAKIDMIRIEIFHTEKIQIKFIEMLYVPGFLFNTKTLARPYSIFNGRKNE